VQDIGLPQNLYLFDGPLAKNIGHPSCTAFLRQIFITSEPVHLLSIHLVVLVSYRVPEEKYAMYLPEIMEEDEERTPRSSVQNLKAATVGATATAAAGTWW
jgi:hypothetical protein